MDKDRQRNIRSRISIGLLEGKARFELAELLVAWLAKEEDSIKNLKRFIRRFTN